MGWVAFDKFRQDCVYGGFGCCGEIGEDEAHGQRELVVGCVGRRSDDTPGARTAPSERPEEGGVLMLINSDMLAIACDNGELKDIIDTCQSW